MRSITILRLGAKRARRHLGLIVVVYLAAALPAWLLSASTSRRYAELLDRSQEAAVALEPGGVAEILVETLIASGVEEPALFANLPLRLALAILLQILLAAGTVEVLLERSVRGSAPLLTGVGRHGWRFLRSFLLFAFLLLIVGGLLVFFTAAAVELVPTGGDDRVGLLVGLAALLAGAGLFALLDLAYDLSRIAAASHGRGRMTVAFARALGHVLVHPWLFATLYVGWLVPLAALATGYYLVINGWAPAGALGLGLAVVLQQLVLLARAALQVWVWSSEIAYYQGIGEPHWSG